MSNESSFKYKRGGDDREGGWRMFGGVNTRFCGDWWQLRPAGQIASTSDSRVVESQTAKQNMSFIWCARNEHYEHPALQERSSGERTLHLDANELSGARAWFGGVLDARRNGALGEDDCDFLHGYPTRSASASDTAGETTAASLATQAFACTSRATFECSGAPTQATASASATIPGSSRRGARERCGLTLTSSRIAQG